MSLQNKQIKLQRQLLHLQQQQFHLQQKLLQKAQHENITKNFKWLDIKANTAMPNNLINAGINNGPQINICHANYLDTGTHPGMLSKEGCVITFGGKIFTKKNYQVLTGKGEIRWQQKEKLMQLRNRYNYSSPRPMIVFGVQPINSTTISSLIPLIGGNESSAPAGPLYICRALIGNQVRVGKVVYNVCNVAWQGKEISLQNFQVLFVK